MRSAQVKKGLSLLLFLGFCTLSQGIFLTSATAQVTPDGTTNTTVDRSGSDFTINQGDRAGSNLFHSFGEFSVPKDGSAFFNNAADIVNIFSRVTGGNISNIDGLLRANSANLFLLNPAGIIFGPNARLDIGGSFFSTTADSFLFEDGEFSATDLDNPPLLTINAPIGLNFRDNPGDIVNQSVAEDVGLQVDRGENITLVGGNINFEGGKITAPGGIVELGGLLAAGTVNINENGSLNFPDGVTRSDVSLNSTATVDVRAGGGGFITVNARNLELLDGSNLFAGIGEGLGETGAVAGDLNIFATGEITARQDSSIQNRINDNGIGDGGDINIETGSLTLTDGSFVSTTLRANGIGNAGDITINATDRLNAAGVDSEGITVGFFSSVNRGAEGNSGKINIKAESFFLEPGAAINTSTSGQGNAGNITIDVDDTVSLVDGNVFSNIEAGAVGNGGQINLTADSISLENGAQLQTLVRSANNELPGGQGNAGNITIDVAGDITLTGSNQEGFPSGIFSSLGQGAVGQAGNINLTGQSLSLYNIIVLD